MLALSALVILTGVDPVQVVEYSIVFSVVILPLTYFPLLLVAGDERVMGANRNGIVANVLGRVYLALVTLAALAAVPLLVDARGAGMTNIPCAKRSRPGSGDGASFPERSHE